MKSKPNIPTSDPLSRIFATRPAILQPPPLVEASAALLPPGLSARPPVVKQPNLTIAEIVCAMLD